MHLKLWQRLFIASATLSVLAVAGLAAWQQHGFRRGFLGYLDKVAVDRLEPASRRLADAYAQHGDWEFLRGRPDRFGELVDDRRDRPSDMPSDEDAPLPALPDDYAPPPRDGVPHGPPRGPPGLMLRLALDDANGVRVVGRPDVPPAARTVAVEYAGRRIGTLRLAPLPEISDVTDVAFAKEQLRNALIAAGVMLVLALPLAFALARWLLKPIRALAAGTQALAAGDYTQRMDVKRRDEIGGLSADFNHLAATLEQHRDARRRWGADLAHELRTPLSILQGEIQALQDGVREPTRGALDSLDAECERLGGLIEDLYQLSLADAGALEYRFEHIDFGELAHDALDLQHRACADAGLALESEIAGGMSIRGDPRRLTQLVANLLANARRYTDAPGRIRVEAKPTRDGTQLVVEDTAPGVPDQALPHLFDRLYRVEGSRSRAAGGAGLGLAICRAIVEAHGGRIDASASQLGGLRVIVDLPRSDAA